MTSTLTLCSALPSRYSLTVVINDIYTKEDAQFLVRHEALTPDRIMGVETGGVRIRRSVRMLPLIFNLEAVAQFNQRFLDLDLILVESGGDNLAATLQSRVI